MIIEKIRIWIKKQHFKFLWNKMSDLCVEMDKEERDEFYKEVEEILPNTLEEEVDSVAERVKLRIEEMELEKKRKMLNS